MKCNVCGRQTVNEEANFCEYCGSSFREHMQQPINQMPPYHQGDLYNQGNPYHAGSVPNMMPGVYPQSNPNLVQPEKPTSFLNWLGTYGIMFIPFVGWLVFIVMLFIWGFGNSASTSKKNWARATLIFVGIGIVLFIAYLALVITVNGDMIQQMMNGTFDYNSYYDSLYNNLE